MDQLARFKGSAARVIRHKVFIGTIVLICALLSGGALIALLVGSKGQSSGVKMRGFGFQSVVTTTDMATIPVTTTIHPTVTISVSQVTTTSAAHNSSTSLTSLSPGTFQTVSTAFAVPAVPTMTSSDVEIRNPISTASLAGILVGIVLLILIVGGIALYVSGKLDAKKLRFWPTGTRVLFQGFRSRATQLQPQNTSRVQSQAASQTTPVNTSHAGVQTEGHQASQTSIDSQAQTILSSMPQTPKRKIRRINVSPASGYEVLDGEVVAKHNKNDKSDDHGGLSAENFDSVAKDTPTPNGMKDWI